MSELVAVARPERATLLEAARQIREDFDTLSPTQMMEATLVIVGEACAQLDTDKKSPAEVIASLSECGMSAEAAEVWVRKAEEVVNSAINKDPEVYARESGGWGISVGTIVFFAAVAGLLFFIWR